MRPVHIDELSTKKPVGPVIDPTIRGRSNIKTAQIAMGHSSPLYLCLLEAAIMPNPEYVSSRLSMSHS